MAMWRWLDRWLAQGLINLIKLYQATISLDHGWACFLKPYGQCRFRPTCSDYAMAAFDKYGVLKGGWKTIKRLIRCNPFNSGGYDPLT